MYTEMYHSYVNFVPAAYVTCYGERRNPHSRISLHLYISSLNFYYKTKNFTYLKTPTIPIPLLITTFNHHLILQSHSSSLYLFISYISTPNLFILLSFFSSPRRPSLPSPAAQFRPSINFPQQLHPRQNRSDSSGNTFMPTFYIFLSFTFPSPHHISQKARERL